MIGQSKIENPKWLGDSTERAVKSGDKGEAIFDSRF
jgi:hypothetical protein